MARTTSHKLGAKSYLVAWGVLMVLTATSLLLHYLPLGAFGPVVAFGIAFAKALVVVYVFMHVLESMFATKMVVLMNLLFVLLVCLGIYADVGFR